MLHFFKINKDRFFYKKIFPVTTVSVYVLDFYIRIHLHTHDCLHCRLPFSLHNSMSSFLSFFLLYFSNKSLNPLTFKLTCDNCVPFFHFVFLWFFQFFRLFNLYFPFFFFLSFNAHNLIHKSLDLASLIIKMASR